MKNCINSFEYVVRSFMAAMCFVTLSFFSSCDSDSSSSEIHEDGVATISFGISSFDYSMTPGTAAPQTRATTINTFNKLELHLYTLADDGSYVPYDASQQSKTITDASNNTVPNPEYGNFTFRVAYGNYKVLALGYYYTDWAKVDTPTDIHFAEDKVPVTFYAWQDLEVSSATGNVSITLLPAVARFVVTATAKLPQDVSQYRLTLNPTGINFDATRAIATQTGERVVTTDVSNKVGQTNTSTNCCLYLTAEELTQTTSDINIVLDALSATGDVLYTHTFENVPFKRGYTTSYKGAFFGHDALSFTLSTNNYEWEDYFDNGYTTF